MKVLLVNGSPHEKGCTYTALCEVEKELKSKEIETEIFWLGNKPVRGCIGCGKCVRDCVSEKIKLVDGKAEFMFSPEPL